MKKVLFLMLFLLVLGTASISAQVRIGGDEAPNAAAVLDLNADNSDTPTENKGGLALPRVNLDDNTAQLNGTDPIAGMLIYNTNTTLGEGVYFWDGDQWVAIGGDGVAVDAVTDATADGGLVRAGSGTAVDPYTLGINDGGVTSSMILDGTIASSDLANRAVTFAKIAVTAYNAPYAGLSGSLGATVTYAAPAGVTRSRCFIDSNSGGYVGCMWSGETNLNVHRMHTGDNSTGYCRVWCFD